MIGMEYSAIKIECRLSQLPYIGGEFGEILQPFGAIVGRFPGAKVLLILCEFFDKLEKYFRQLAHLFNTKFVIKFMRDVL